MNKKRSVFYLFAISSIILFGCVQKSDKENAEAIPEFTDTVNAETNLPVISDKLIPFIKLLSTTGFNFDTVRFEKLEHYPELKRPAIYIEEIPLYSVDIASHIIIQGIKNPESLGGLVQTQIDETAFLNAEEIIAYAFYWQNESGELEDGVIEQWKFISPERATAALNEFDKFQGKAYFNTESYASADQNYFFLFHARARQFCYTLEDIYNRFILFKGI